MGILSLVTFLPVLGGLALLLLPRAAERLQRAVAIGFSLATFVASIQLWLRFEPGVAGMQLGESSGEA